MIETSTDLDVIYPTRMPGEGAGHSLRVKLKRCQWYERGELSNYTMVSICLSNIQLENAVFLLAAKYLWNLERQVLSRVIEYVVLAIGLRR